MSDVDQPAPIKRSAGSLARRREPLPWPRDRDFRILSIDGGGIKGIFPASVLAGIEARFLGGRSAAQFFDLIAGTSTGGIIALGLAAGLTATEIRDLYLKHGESIFPTYGGGAFGRVMRWARRKYQYVSYIYDRAPLERLLSEALGDRLIGDAKVRLNIPAFEGRHSEVYIYKTPHHPDFKLDAREKMITAALATSAAPTFFRALPTSGYTMVDGGVWANNPTMIALVDALSCFDVDRHRVNVLSLGCGEEPYVVTKSMMRGGFWQWKEVIGAAMHLQSLNALGQTRLLIGAERVMRIDPQAFEPPIAMDDFLRSAKFLPDAAQAAVDQHGPEINTRFFYDVAAQYLPHEGAA